MAEVRGQYIKMQKLLLGMVAAMNLRYLVFGMSVGGDGGDGGPEGPG